MQALALWSGTSVTRVVNVLRYIIYKLRDTCNQSSLPFEECCFLLPRKSKQLVVLDATIKRSHTGIAGMKRRISKEKLNIFTVLVSLFVLSQDDDRSYALSCKFLGVNRQGNYTACGLDNISVYDKYLQITGDIVPGEIILCRNGFGELTSEYEQSITITLKPWKYKMVYTFGNDKSGTACTARKRARMTR